MIGSWRGLVCDGGQTRLSLGRAATWLVLGAALWCWVWCDRDIHPGHLTVLLGLLAYVTGSKVLAVPRTVTTRETLAAQDRADGPLPEDVRP